MPILKSRIETVADLAYLYSIWRPKRFLLRILVALNVVSAFALLRGMLRETELRSNIKPDPNARCWYCEANHDPDYCSVAIIKESHEDDAGHDF